jgi:hypothetical protein
MDEDGDNFVSTIGGVRDDMIFFSGKYPSFGGGFSDTPRAGYPNWGSCQSVGLTVMREPFDADRWHGHWLGLPPLPVWWSWFGSEYAGLVEPSLTPTVTRFATGAIFTSLSDSPRHSDELGVDRPASGSWRPEELVAKVDMDSQRFTSRFPADVIPDTLPAS